MKRMVALTMIASLAAVALSGCVKSNPAQTKVYTPMGTVKYHCPPGQAKKGRCVSLHRW